MTPREELEFRRRAAATALGGLLINSEFWMNKYDAHLVDIKHNNPPPIEEFFAMWAVGFADALLQEIDGLEVDEAVTRSKSEA